MLSLKAFLSERLTAAAEEIFSAVEKTIIEYKEELCRSKDIEITRLRMQLKILKSEPQSMSCLGAQLLQHAHHLHSLPPAQQQQLHQAASAVDQPEAQHYEEEEEEEEEDHHHHHHQHHHEEEGGSMEQEHPEPSQVKKEPTKGHRDFWMAHDAEQLSDLESDMKDFIAPPAGLKMSLHDPALIFHPYHHNGGEEGRDKPYCCSVCEKRFSNCSHLAAHIRTHTGERPYRCEICRKTFITTSALNRHQTIHTEGKHFVCTYCGKSFKWMESLGRHIRVVHKKPDVPDAPEVPDVPEEPVNVPV